MWFVFFGGGHVGTLEARRLATPWPVAHDGDDANDGGEGGTARLPFCAADSPRACGRIMPRAAWGWTDRAMQRSFPLPGASRRLEALERRGNRGGAPPKFYRFGVHGSPHGRSKATGGQMPEARGQKQETRRGKGGGGGRRGADLSGWLRLPGLQTGCRPRSLGDPLCPSFPPPQLTHDSSSQRFAFYPSIEGTR